MFDWLRDNKGVQIDFLNSTDEPPFAIFSMTSKDQAKRQMSLGQTPEAIHLEISKKAQPAGRRYLVLEVVGTIIESGDDFEMPPIKYYFA